MSLDQELLTPAQAAEELGLSVRRVQQLCRAGDLGTKVGGRYLITRSELERFKDSDRPGPGNPNFGRR
jgi:excisionase family DNA binding protein